MTKMFMFILFFMLSIGQLASQMSETVKTLRYWTDHGLLASERGENGYRYYPPDAAKRIDFIRRTQALGFKLSEIKSILTLRADGVKPCAEVRDDLATHLQAVQQRIHELKALEGELSVKLKWAERHPDPDCEEGCVYLVDVVD